LHAHEHHYCWNCGRYHIDEFYGYEDYEVCHECLTWLVCGW
jgi:hypothetical protein